MDNGLECEEHNIYNIKPKIMFFNSEYDEKDFKELRKMINGRRRKMYRLFRIYLVDPETLKFDFQLAIGKKKVNALIKAHRASIFATTDLDLLEVFTETIMEFEKKKDLKKAVETIKGALG